MGKPCVLFFLNTRGIDGSAACRLNAQGAEVLPQLPHKPQQVQGGTRSWEVWGASTTVWGSLCSPDSSPAVLGAQWALGWLGVCVWSLWGMAGNLPGTLRAASG